MKVKDMIELLKKVDPEKTIKFEVLTEFGYTEGHEQGRKTNLDIKDEGNNKEIVLRIVYR